MKSKAKAFLSGFGGLLLFSATIGIIATIGGYSRSKSATSFVDHLLRSEDFARKTFAAFLLGGLVIGFARIVKWLIARLAASKDGSETDVRRASAVVILAVLALVWLFFMEQEWVNQFPVLRGTPVGVINFDVLKLLLLPVVILPAFGWLAYIAARRKNVDVEPVGLVHQSSRGDLPALQWSQLAASGETVASNDLRFRIKFWQWMIVVGALIGLLTGGLVNMVFGAMMGGFLGAFFQRGAGPNPKSEMERREETTPIAQREDCEAFLLKTDDTILFCLARGDRTKGTLPVVERVPLDSFGNFEEGSHKQWFRARGSVSDLADWGVIVAQSNVGRVVHVAESVDDHAWLVELLVRLQNTFIVPRDKLMHEFRETEQKRRAHDAPVRSSDTPPINDAPVTPF